MVKRVSSAGSNAYTAGLAQAVAVPVKCFIIMSFSGNTLVAKNYNYLYMPIFEKNNVEPCRIDRKSIPGQSITDHIFSNIESSDIVLADLTEDRENCYFELRYAFTLKNPVIITKMAAPKYEFSLPFDIQNFQCIIFGDIDDLRGKCVKVLSDSIMPFIL